MDKVSDGNEGRCVCCWFTRVVACCLLVVFMECVHDGGGVVYDLVSVLHGEVLGC